MFNNNLSKKIVKKSTIRNNDYKELSFYEKHANNLMN